MISKVKRKYQKDGLSSVIISAPDYISNRVRNGPSRLADNAVELFSMDRENFRQWSQKNGRIWNYGSNGTFDVAPPLTNQVPLKYKQRDVEGTHQYKTGFVAEIPEAKLIGSRALCQLPTGEIVLEPLRTKSNLRTFLYDELSSEDGIHVAEDILRTRYTNDVRGSNFETSEYDTVVHMTTRHAPPRHSGANYGHWICEYLPQLLAVERYQQETAQDPKLLLNNNPPSWMTETLELMGYSAEDWIKWDEKTRTVENVIIPQRHYLHSHKAEYNPLGKQWVRSKITNAAGAPGEDKYSDLIFLSRQDAEQNRKIVNIKEVKDRLSPLGFEFYRPGTLNLTEQINLFSQAKVIVGPYGSNMAGIMYSNNASVVTILPDDYFGMFYWVLSNELGLFYDFVTGEDGPHCNEASPQRHQDILVDVDKLKNTIKNAAEVIGV